MNNVLRLSLVASLAVALTSCSEVLQTVDLTVSTEDNSAQEEFNVVEKTLTLAEARAQRRAPYPRRVIQSGRGTVAGPIAERSLSSASFPRSAKAAPYRIGAGDRVNFTRLIDNQDTTLQNSVNWPDPTQNNQYKIGIGDELALVQINEGSAAQNSAQIAITRQLEDQSTTGNAASFAPAGVIKTTGRIGSDGSVLLLEVGRLNALGKTLSQLRGEVRNILIRNGLSPKFQLDIVNFASQRAYVTLNAAATANDGQGGRVLTLTDQPITLREVLSQAGIGLSPRAQTKVELQRDGQSYVMDLARIYSNGSPEIIIQDRDHIFVEEGISQAVGTTALVGQDGFVVLEGIGKVDVANKTVDEVSQEIKSTLANTSAARTDFQIEVVEFASQRALISIPGAVGEDRGTQSTTGINVGNASGAIVPITNIPITLEEALTERGVTLDGQYITRIALQRAGRKYSFTLRDLLETTSARVYLQGGDRVTVERLGYKSNKVFVLGGVTPTIVNIDPEIRQTLADILFTSDGVLSAPGANRSEVYLLRGTDPVVAYHLDAQSPTRLIVADAMELRPNDILYVAEQPIVSFNRTLATITPLRAVLQEIGNELN
jgi:protein involved in polysaccharide export with SLBB domain